MKFRKSILAFSVSQAVLGGTFAVTGMMAATPSMAQTAEQAAPSADDAAIGVVTVTAQSRTQQSQAVPISMQVVTGDQISKLAANNLSDMNGYIPGFSVSGDQPTQPGYNLRGLGTSDFGIGTDSPVGVYVDGVYTGKTGGALMNFNDTERVEVLKGPQGTLFGRNSAAGAISIVTKDPSFDFEEDAHVRFAQYGERYADALLNVPLNDTTALRFSFVDTKSDGWLTDAATGQRLNSTGDWGLRTSLRWDAPGQTKVILSWEHESLDENARPDIGLIPLSLQTPTPPVPANPATYLNPLNAPVYNDVAGDMETRVFDGVTLRVEHPLGWATFNSTTAYRHFNSGNLEGNDGTNQLDTYLDTNNIENNTTWQQEFKLSGKNDTVDWLTGASLFGETAHQTSQVDTYTDAINTLYSNQSGGLFPLYSVLNEQLQGAGLPLNLLGNSWQESMINKDSSKSYALYGDAIWHVTQKMDLTTGVRFTYDSKEFSWFNPSRSAPGLDADLGMLPPGVLPSLISGINQQLSQFGQSYTGAGLTQNIEFTNPAAMAGRVTMSNSWTDVSPRIVLDYKLMPDVMVFGSVSKGYQSGGFNALAVAGVYQPETVWNYEAGFKSYFREQHLLFNASVFSYKFSNLQSLNLINNGAAIPTYQVTSSDQSAIGVDIDARWQPTHDLRFFFASEYINQNYDNFLFPGGPDLSNQPVGTPLWSVAGGFDYTQRGIFGGSVNYSLQHAYTGASRCNSESLEQGTCGNLPTFSVGTSTQRTDARIGWNSDNHRWGIALYANNLLNNRYVTGIDKTSNLAGLGTPAATISAPRVIGVELHAGM